MGLDLHRTIQHLRTPLISTMGVVAGVIAATWLGVFQLLEWQVRDRFFLYRPVEARDDRIVLVTINEADIVTAGNWPIPDAVLARLIQQIAAQRPRVIGLDLYRNLPQEPGYQQLLKVLRSTPNLIGVEKIIGDRVAAPPALKDLNRIGFADLVLDQDQYVRRGLLSAIPTSTNSQIKTGLAAQVALAYLKPEGFALEMVDPTQQQFRLGKALLTPLKNWEARYSPQTLGGYQILMNWRGAESAFHQISMTQVLRGQIPAGLLRDRLVFIGSIADSTNDFFQTPYTNSSQTPRRSMAGVAVHANLASQLIASALDGRPLLRGLLLSQEGAWIILWAIVGITVSWRLAQPKTSQFFSLPGNKILLGLVLSSALLVTGSYLLFLTGILVPVVAPWVALVASTIASTIASKQLQLQRTNDQLETANQKLLDYSITLETRVKQRTQELETATLAADAANRAKSQFLASMSHELRTPLNGILGFAQLMAHDPLLPTIHRENLEIILHSADHLLELINGVLDMSKIEAGHTTLNFDSCDLTLLLDSLQETFQLKAAGKGLQLVMEQGADVPRYVCTDGGKLRQILMNLLSNAIKFTATGTVSLRVSSQPLDPKTVRQRQPGCETCSQGKDAPQLPAYELQFEIEDTGVGITPADLRTLFQPFVQTESGRQSSQGTGLGLAISQKFAHLLGGVIQISSVLHQGTRVQLVIPVCQTAAIAPPREQTAPKVLGLMPHQPVYRLLIVEDRWTHRRLLNQMLAPLGFEVRQAENGQVAVNQWEQWQPHLIWMDIRMPVMDGYEAIRQIREREQAGFPQGSISPSPANPAVAPQQVREPWHEVSSEAPKGRTKIIALTASAFDNERERLLEMGCDDFVRKPFQEQEIFAKLHEHLGVQFIYADQEPAAAIAADVLSPESLATLPADWLKNFREATIELRIETMLSLIHQLRDRYPNLANRLTELTETFQYDQLIALLDHP